MKKLNKKGFTLIELLAVIIILGVLLLIAVPSVSKYITNSRISTYETNLSRLVDAVTVEVNSYKFPYTFTTDQVLVVPAVCIELEKGNATKTPFGTFEAASTYVVVSRKTSGAGFDYKIAALDTIGYGVALTDVTALEGKVSSTPGTITEITNLGTAPAITIDSKTGRVTHTVTGDAANGYTCNAYTPPVTP